MTSSIYFQINQFLHGFLVHVIVGQKHNGSSFPLLGYGLYGAVVTLLIFRSQLVGHPAAHWLGLQ